MFWGKSRISKRSGELEKNVDLNLIYQLEKLLLAPKSGKILKISKLLAQSWRNFGRNTDILFLVYLQ